MGTRRRLSAEERRSQLIEAAAGLLLEQGHLPAPPERVAQAAGVSKALVYAYFRDPHDLYNEVVARDFVRLAAAGLEAASSRPGLESAAMACGDLYFRHVAAYGPVAHLVLRDVYMAGRLRSDLAAFRDRIALRLARLARRELKLSAREAVAALNLVVTIPEETGRLVWQGDLDPERGGELAERLIGAAIKGLSPAASDQGSPLREP